MIYDKAELQAMKLPEMRELALKLGIMRASSKTKVHLIDEILLVQDNRQNPQKTREFMPISPLNHPINKPANSNKNKEETVGKKIMLSSNPLELTIFPLWMNYALVGQKASDFADDFDDSVFNQKRGTNTDAKEEEASFLISGIVELNNEGYGYLRTVNYCSSKNDLYLPAMQIKRFSLRTGDKLKVKARFFSNNKYASVIFIYEINDVPCDQLKVRGNFNDLVPTYPTQRIRLEDGKNKLDLALRVIDLVAPIGKGQRGLIVSPPKAGKTTLLKNIASAISKNYPEIHLMMLLIDERPEEVTDIKDTVPDAEIVYSTFDMTPEHHTQVAELVLKNAIRNVEIGRHVVILLDSITRLARSYNQTAEQSGRVLTGGLDSAALSMPKKFFGSARSIKDGGSLTVIATALVDTGSRMDDIIYEEFKGTGNMEIHLSRRASERRIFPAIDLNKSGTRREDLLMTPKELEGMWKVRRNLAKGDPVETAEHLIEMLLATKNNEEFFNIIKSV